MHLYLIKSLPDTNTQECMQSLLGTAGAQVSSAQISLINERETREETLNHILSLHDKAEDMFIVADDIRFRPGWFEAVRSHLEKGDIIGFSMIDPQTGLLQDFGYDFITIDGKLSYRGLYKHEHPDSVALPQFRACDAVTGCAMFIKGSVLKKVNHFPLEGMNRWGEMLFCVNAKQQGFSTIVLSHHLDHFAISTKQKSSVDKSSLSWLVEQDLWKKVVDKYLTQIHPSQQISRALDKQLRHKLETASFPLIYGCGTIADFVISETRLENFMVCSGLAEEVGARFHDHVIQDVKKINFNVHDLILITPLGYNREILKFFPNGIKHKVTAIKIKMSEDEWTYYKQDIIHE